MKLFLPRFVGALLFFLVLLLIGTGGYLLIEGWSVGDALYMTVITLTAVGYAEVMPLSPEGRTFTMFLLAGGVTWMGVWFALITALLVELDLTDVLRKRKLMREISGMHDHFIVCGGGRTGRQVVQELEAMERRWVLIERDPERVAEVLASIPSAYVIEGDATSDQTLVDAGLERAKGLVTCLSADADNLFVCLSARDLNQEMTIVARAYETGSMQKLYRAGATHVVSPNLSGAIRMASVLVRPSVVSFLDIATRSSDLALRMEQMEVAGGAEVAGRTLAEARIPEKTGLIVIAVREGGGDEEEFVFNPVADTRLDPGDQLIVLGRPSQIEDLRSYVGS